MEVTELETERLILRQWKSQDLVPFAKLNSDHLVMEYFPSVLNRQESDAMADKCKSLISDRGWGFWALELKSDRTFIGFVGIHIPKDTLPFSPCVEIGWRLQKHSWGQGYATESANKALEFCFKNLNLKEVVSFTPASNYRSRSLMERLGLSNTNENFIHPDIPKNHSLSECVLYKIKKNEWSRMKS